jgi:Hint domain/Bacterial Ig domain
MVDATKLPIDTSASAMQMAEAMFGAGIKIESAKYTGDPLSKGIYTQGDTIAPDATPSDTGVILSTGRATNFTNASGEANQTASRSTDTSGVNNDAQMNSIAGVNTFDAAIFEASFIPDGSVLTMQITFSSEEYLEYVGSGFNDAVGVWVNGQKAELTVGNGDISINNISDKTNSNLYVDNAKDQFNTEMDGFTVTLTLKAPVIAGKVNTIKIGIADGGDSVWDSNLLIAANSVQTAVIAVDDSFEVRRGEQVTVDLVGNDKNFTGGKLFITKINNIPVVANETITLPSGLELIVNENGTITILSEADDKLVGETFSYEVSDGGFITDVGFVTGTIVPCFVAGARIETARGAIPVEEVEVGDLVRTLDDGWQPVRWHGQREVPSQGSLAAVRIPAGTFGDHGALSVSPQHRLHFEGWRAELYCGEAEVLVKAIHLVRAGLLQQDRSGAPVSYHHLLFDRHQVIRAEGLWSESYHPGPMTLGDDDAEMRDEIFTLFPELAADLDAYGPSARPEAAAHVARLLAV